MRGAARKGRVLLGLALAVVLAAPALAQQPTPTRPKLKPRIPAAGDTTGAAPSRTPSPVAPAEPPLVGATIPRPGGSTASVPPAPAPVAPAPVAALSTPAWPPAPPQMSSAVQSRWSRPAGIARSTTGQCRETCALDRNRCAAGLGDPTQCDPNWTRCLSTCEGLSYGRGP